MCSAEALAEAETALERGDLVAARAAAANARAALLKADRSCTEVDDVEARIAAAQDASDLAAEANALLEQALAAAREDGARDLTVSRERLICARAAADKFVAAQASVLALQTLPSVKDGGAESLARAQEAGSRPGDQPPTGLAALLVPDWRQKWDAGAAEVTALLDWRQKMVELLAEGQRVLRVAEEAADQQHVQRALDSGAHCATLARDMVDSAAQLVPAVVAGGQGQRACPVSPGGAPAADGGCGQGAEGGRHLQECLADARVFLSGLVQEEGSKLVADAEGLIARSTQAMDSAAAAAEASAALTAGEELLKEDKLAEASAHAQTARTALARVVDQAVAAPLEQQASLLDAAVARARAAEDADDATAQVRQCVDAADFEGARAHVMRASEALQRCEVEEHEAIVLNMLSQVNAAEQLHRAATQGEHLLSEAETALAAADEPAARRALEAAYLAVECIGQDQLPSAMRARFVKVEVDLGARDEAARNVSEAAKALSASEQLLAGEHDTEAASVAVAAAAEAVEAAVVMAEGNARLEPEVRQLQERLGRVRQILADATARAAARKVRLCVHARAATAGPGAVRAAFSVRSAHDFCVFGCGARGTRCLSRPVSCVLCLGAGAVLVCGVALSARGLSHSARPSITPRRSWPLAPRTLRSPTLSCRQRVMTTLWRATWRAWRPCSTRFRSPRSRACAVLPVLYRPLIFGLWAFAPVAACVPV